MQLANKQIATKVDCQAHDVVTCDVHELFKDLRADRKPQRTVHLQSQTGSFTMSSAFSMAKGAIYTQDAWPLLMHCMSRAASNMMLCSQQTSGL